MKNSKGVTLTELMVAAAILTVGVLGGMGSFQYITKSIRISRIRTIANNLGQEKIESLKNISYNALLVTTNTYTNNNFNPALVYDTVNYPPETNTMWGGAPLTRAVFVAYAAPIGNSISTLPYTSNDPGLKLVRVHVFWNQDGTWRNWSITNLLENPNVAVLDSTISGTVTKVPSGALAGALVQAVGSPHWQATTDSSGNYSFQVVHGSYTVTASLSGYYSQTSGLLSVTAGNPVTQNFQLTAIGSGTVSSYGVYVDSNLVVSQVVASTMTQGGDGSSHDIEYVELFNPTNNAINIGQGASPVVQLNYKDECSPCGTDAANIALTYVSTYVAPGKYYLISSATNFLVLGNWVNADAYYPTLYKDIIIKNHSGAVYITDSSGNIINGVGWNKSGADADCMSGNCLAPWKEGNAININGLRQGDQIVRMSSACAINTSYGRAYESYDNANNFSYNTNTSPPPYFFSYPPYNTSTTRAVISGVPSVGGYAVANDGLSSEVSLVTGNATTPAPYNQSCPYANFNITAVATGTWNVQVSTGIYLQTITNVSVTQGATTAVLNGATNPVDPTGFNYVPITSTTANGYVFGTVADGSNNPIAGIVVYAGGATNITGGTGRYWIAASPGTVTVYANQNQQNPNYISASAVGVVINIGRTTTQNFVLAQGGTFQGYIANADLSPLPGIVATATSTASNGSAASDNTGYFYIPNLSTGAYTVTPTLDPTQTSSPASFTNQNLTAPGSTVFVGTFTITGGLGTIKGSVLNNGNPITAGVLVIASTGTISDPAPAVYASSSASTVVYYSVSSLADGTYILPVKGSASSPYNLRAFYPVVDVNSGAVTLNPSHTLGPLTVNPGTTVTGQNFTWP